MLFQVFKLFQLRAQGYLEHAGMRDQLSRQARAMPRQTDRQPLLCSLAQQLLIMGLSQLLAEVVVRHDNFSPFDTLRLAGVPVTLFTNRNFMHLAYPTVGPNTSVKELILITHLWASTRDHR
jgi:hypothetical protein